MSYMCIYYKTRKTDDANSSYDFSIISTLKNVYFWYQRSMYMWKCIALSYYYKCVGRIIQYTNPL